MEIPFSAEQLTLSGLLGVAILSIILGWLVPRWLYNQAVKRAEDEKDAKDKALDANKILAEALLKALSKDDAAHAAVHAIREKAHEA